MNDAGDRDNTGGVSASRRATIQRALGAALAAATPSSVLALAERGSRDRFLIVTLRDGRLLAIDRSDNRRAFILTRHAARDGDYALARSGSVEVRGGALRGVKGSAATSAYNLKASGASVLVNAENGPNIMRIPVAPAR